MTASGGNFIECEFNRNKRAPRWGVAPIEVAEDAFDRPIKLTINN